MTSLRVPSSGGGGCSGPIMLMPQLGPLMDWQWDCQNIHGSPGSQALNLAYNRLQLTIRGNENGGEGRRCLERVAGLESKCG
jgi:hypothetical protein